MHLYSKLLSEKCDALIGYFPIHKIASNFIQVVFTILCLINSDKSMVEEKCTCFHEMKFSEERKKKIFPKNAFKSKCYRLILKGNVESFSYFPKKITNNFYFGINEGNLSNLKISHQKFPSPLKKALIEEIRENYWRKWTNPFRLPFKA